MAVDLDESRQLDIAQMHAAATSDASVAALPLGDLLDLASQVVREVTGRLARPDFLAFLAPVEPEEDQAAPDSFPTLPRVQEQVTGMARVIEGAATAVAGHTARVFEDPDARHRLLGLPKGKTRFRSSADFLEKTQQTPQRQTRERENRASQHLAPAPAADGSSPDPGPLLTVSGAFWEASVDPTVVDIITRTLTKARGKASSAQAPRNVVEPWLRDGEAHLMALARRQSPGVVSQACRRWLIEFQEQLEAVSVRPSADRIHQGRGAKFIREEDGLFLWHLMLTQDQHEVLKTVTSAGANPRARKNADSSGPESPCDDLSGQAAPSEDLLDVLNASQDADGRPVEAPEAPVRERLEDRQRREVDAIITALAAALRLLDSGLPASGGYAPQVMAVIDYETLLRQIQEHPNLPPAPPVPQHLLRPGEGENGPPGTPPSGPSDSSGPMVSLSGFNGPIDPRIIRAWACDAEIIPVVLGGEGQVLDVGAGHRVFPPKLRRAIIARDRGCAAPDCYIPAAWCDVHHVQYWQHGGPTSIDNGALLCRHHHQSVHHDHLVIHMRNGVPWFESPGPYGNEPVDRTAPSSLQTVTSEQDCLDVAPVHVPTPQLTRNEFWHDIGEPPW